MGVVLFFEGVDSDPFANLSNAEGWTIYNAPRPLYGHQIWQGEFKHGKFYAAVSPEGDPIDELGDAKEFHRRNVELDGWICKWVTAEQVDAWFALYATWLRASPEVIARQDYNARVRTYAQHHHRSLD